MSLTVDSTHLHHAFSHAFTNAFAHPLMDFNCDNHKENVIDLTEASLLPSASLSPSASALLSPSAVIDLTGDDEADHSPPSPKKRTHTEAAETEDSASEIESDEEDEDSESEAESEADEEEDDFCPSPTKRRRLEFLNGLHEDNFYPYRDIIADCGVPQSWNHDDIAFVIAQDEFRLELMRPYLSEIDRLTNNNEEVTDYHKKMFFDALKALADAPEGNNNDEDSGSDDSDEE